MTSAVISTPAIPWTRVLLTLSSLFYQREIRRRRWESLLLFILIWILEDTHHWNLDWYYTKAEDDQAACYIWSLVFNFNME